MPGQRRLKKSELGASRAQQSRAAPDQPAELVFCFLFVFFCFLFSNTQLKEPCSQYSRLVVGFFFLSNSALAVLDPPRAGRSRTQHKIPLPFP